MKKSIFLLLLLSILMLAGCEKRDDAVSKFLDTYIEEAVKKNSNLEEDDSFVKYEQILRDENIVDGYVSSDEVDYTVLEDVDAVHVTFAINSYLPIKYYSDAERTHLLNEGGAYLHENDSIYAEVGNPTNPNTDSYEFIGFEVWEFEKDGNKKRELETEPFNDGLVYQIPMGFDVREISIIPLGSYKPRVISLRDYYKDNNGLEKELAGRWIVNGDQTVNDSISVNPVESYTVSYIYDATSYEFESSEPSCLYNNAEEGIISFEEFSADKNMDGFSVELHKKSDDQRFDPSQYSIDHAEITYKYQGALIEAPMFIPNGGKIEYQITNVEEGYWIPGNEQGEIEVEKISEIVENCVCKKEKVRVNLPQPVKGGKITYFIDDEKQEDSIVHVYIGTDIKMFFTSDGGWSCGASDGTVYRVSATDNQTINVEGEDVNNIFTEQQYKPKVIFTIDKSVNTYTEFSIVGVDVNETGLKLEDEKKNFETFWDDFGIKDDLTISCKEGSLLKGEALKFVIEKNYTGEKSKDIDICYLQKIPDSIKIPLYVADDSVVYETVKVAVSKVNVIPFINSLVDNGSITVKTADLTNNRVLNEGDVIEGSRKVEISIAGKNGYYVKDSGKADIYSDVLTYLKYEAEIDSILKKHPVKKFCTVTLDTTDLFGKVTYKIDGKIVEAGNYSLKEEQKLSLSYEITDGKHEIVRDASNLLDQAIYLAKSKTKESVDVPITSVLDGETVTRDMYISVKNK